MALFRAPKAEKDKPEYVEPCIYSLYSHLVLVYIFLLFLLSTHTAASMLLPVFQSMYSRVPECQITTYYYVGFAYLMMRRYQDAIRVFANILLYIQRTRNMFQRSTYKYEMVQTQNMFTKVFFVTERLFSDFLQNSVMHE